MTEGNKKIDLKEVEEFIESIGAMIDEEKNFSELKGVLKRLGFEYRKSIELDKDKHYYAKIKGKNKWESEEFNESYAGVYIFEIDLTKPKNNKDYFKKMWCKATIQ